MSRRPLIAGNWKMNLTVPEAEDLVRKLAGATARRTCTSGWTSRCCRRSRCSRRCGRC